MKYINKCHTKQQLPGSHCWNKRVTGANFKKQQQRSLIAIDARQFHLNVPRLTLVSSCGWFPVLRVDDRQADLTLFVNVWVVDFCLENNLGGLERVVCREGDLNPKCSLFIRRTVLEQNKSFQIVNATRCINCHIGTFSSFKRATEVWWAPIQYLQEQWGLASTTNQSHLLERCENSSIQTRECQKAPETK